MKNILFVASECVPFIKTGGLADVVGSLPKCFNKDEFDCRVIIPKYKCMKQQFVDQFEYVTNFYMELSWRKQYVGIFKTVYEGVTIYMIDNEFYFNGDKPYSDMGYDIEKFTYFSRAALSILPVIGFKPDIIHCHDWQTGLIPVYLKDCFAGSPFYRDMKSIMTIHNLKFQGIWDIDHVKDIAGLSDYYFTTDKMFFENAANLLKGGIVFADYVTTVSDTYAEEIKTPFYGEKLDGLMRYKSDRLVGIVNGIDYDAYNPETDPYIYKNYNVDTFRKLKKANKVKLQEELGLDVDDKKMMIGIVSRLTDQKGFDLIDCMMDELCKEDIQIVVLGTGDEKYENMFRYYADKYKNKVSAHIYYSEEMSHKIYASCDAFLMPSLFEPCGLSQLMSLRYGTVPIVRETGGLKDTVEPYNEYENKGTGFSFTNYNAHEMMHVIRYAIRTYYDKKREWNKIVDRGMMTDYSWGASACKYEELYRKLLSE